MPDNWQDWSKYVLKELERLNTAIDAIREECVKIRVNINELHIEVATLKTEFRIRAGIWGAVAGAIPAAIIIVYYVVKAGK
jgi:hypothetical protein